MLLLLLNFWTDLGIFALGVIAASLLLQGWLRCRGGGFSRAGWIAVGCSLVIAALLVQIADSNQRRIMRERLEGFAPTYAQELQLMGLEHVGLDTPPDSPLYLSMIAAEIRWLTVNPGVSDIYTMRRLPDGRVVLLVDSETDYDHNGRYDGEREQRTAIGEVYEQTTPNMLRAFDGQAAFDDEPVSDRWGVWVSAYVPVRDSRGRVDTVLGVDFDARSWTTAIALSRLGALGLSGVICCVVLAAVAIISLTRAESARNLALQRQLLIASREAALHDGLTGLPNRLMFGEKLDQAIRRSKVDPNFLFAVMFVDCDNFKTVNDTLGHNAGDMLLRQIGQRIRSVVRGADDVAARVGGDEFAILLSGLRSAADATTIASRLLHSAGAPYDLGTQQVHSGMSVGLTTSANGYQTAEQMVQAADAAMYRAKRGGRNRCELVDRSMKAAA